MTSILAISGGPDSVYLLHQLITSGEKPILAHLNHQLRGPHSDEDETFVRELARRHDLLIEVAQVDVATYATTHKKSLETAGRILRYEFFEKVRQQYGADQILLAHHLNDNLETVLMNEQRGCHVRGRIGMREKNGFLTRPLLNLPKSDILAFLHHHHIAYRTDPTNQDPRHLRNRIRHQTIPSLLEKNPHLLSEFQQNRAHAIQEYKTLRTWATKWFQAHPDRPRAQFLSLTNAEQQNLIQHMYERTHGSTFNLTTAQIQEVQKMIHRGHGGKHRTLGPKLQIWLKQGKIIFEEKPLSPTC